MKKEPHLLANDSSDDDIEILYDSITAKEPAENCNTKSDSEATSSVVDLGALRNDIDGVGITLDDEGELVLPEDEMTINDVHAVDIAIEYEKIVNCGAHPDFSWKDVEAIINDLRRYSCYQKADEQILNHYGSNLQVHLFIFCF